jgi:hypothetical protein
MGCQYPNGLTRKEWMALPYAERDRLIHEDMARDEQGKMQEVRAKQEHIASSYKNAKYGDVVDVNLTGSVVRGGIARPFKAVNAEIVKGQQIEALLIDGTVGITRSISIRLGEDGNAIFLEGFESCNNDGWDRGQAAWKEGKSYHPKEKRINESGAKDITLTVRFKPLP